MSEQYEVTHVPDSKLPHLSQPQCSCGWKTAGFVPRSLAVSITERHLSEHEATR